MNYSEKVRRLQDRRLGLYTSTGAYDSVAALTASRKIEKFASIGEPASVKYALGSMQRVDDEYTKNTYVEGDRVRDRLTEGLSSAGIPAKFEYQGSVPLDVHVKGNSDIDLLVIHDGFVTVDAEAGKVYSYSNYMGKPATEELSDLRTESIAILKRRYYEAKVDTSGSKSITLSGGSLKRIVDVVPSHWHDTLDWKRTGEKHHREIFILDSHANARIKNQPFMHIKNVEIKCIKVGGTLRKIIRLLKNLKYDATPEISLSSYDIAAIAWQMSESELSVPYGVDLLLTERVRTHLARVITDDSYRNSLWVPDGSRRIYDKSEKLSATIRLFGEVNQLVQDIYTELDPLGKLYNRPNSQVLAKAVYL